MRKNYGAKPFSYPQPVFIIAAYDENAIHEFKPFSEAIF